jgi:hypothetical protein
MAEAGSSTLLRPTDLPPPAADALGKSPELRKLVHAGIDASKPQASHTETLNTMRRNAGELKAAILNQFPKFPEARVEAMIDWVFGYTRLSDKTLLTSEGAKENIAQKDLSARIQHGLAHQILHASESTDDEYTGTVYTAVRNLHTLTGHFGRGGDSNIGLFWHGLRNEVGVIRALQDHDYRVFLPDYAQDTAEIDDRDNEVLQLDVLGGIDFIAVSPNAQMFLIDAKGKFAEEAIVRELQTHPPKKFDPSEGINPTVIEALVRIAHVTGAKLTDAYKLKLVIPTSAEAFEGTDLTAIGHKDPEKQRDSLRRFGALRPAIVHGIMTQIESAKRGGDNHVSKSQ